MINRMDSENNTMSLKAQQFQDMAAKYRRESENFMRYSCSQMDYFEKLAVEYEKMAAEVQSSTLK